MDILNNYLCYGEMLWGNIRTKEANTRDPDHILLVLKMGFYWEKYIISSLVIWIAVQLMQNQLLQIITRLECDVQQSGFLLWRWWTACAMQRRWQLDTSLLFAQEKQQDPCKCTKEVYSIAVLNENALHRAGEGLTDFHLIFALAWIHFP